MADALPFAVGAQAFAPDRATMQFFIWFVGFANLLIHTPWLEEASTQYLPAWVVTTAGHGSHHRKLKLNYAAPTLNIDFFVRKSARVDRYLAGVFGKAYEEKSS